MMESGLAYDVTSLNPTKTVQKIKIRMIFTFNTLVQVHEYKMLLDYVMIIDYRFRLTKNF